MKKILLLSLFSAMSVQAVENQKTVCSHGNATRVIEVVYTAGTEIPCEVRYSKEDGMTTPWRANNLVGFCEKKAAAFIDKQETWGWVCEVAPNISASDERVVSANEGTEVTNDLPVDDATEITPDEVPEPSSVDTKNVEPNIQ